MFTKASKKDGLKLRIALSGSAGSGKTYTALNLAQYMGKSIALIDTEHESSLRYAEDFSFDYCPLSEHHPLKYTEAIKFASDYDVLIIDSLSHAWFSIIDLVDKMGGNLIGWKKVKPIENQLLEAMLSFEGHLIVTMRTKTEYVMDTYKGKDGKDKSAPRKVGLAPIQREGLDYEFDIAGLMVNSGSGNDLVITKSRCFSISNQVFHQPGEYLANILLNWSTNTPEETEPEKKEKPIYSSWKSPSDAIAWAHEQLPHNTVEELQASFDSISQGNSGKKAKYWYDFILRHKEQWFDQSPDGSNPQVVKTLPHE